MAGRARSNPLLAIWRIARFSMLTGCYLVDLGWHARGLSTLDRRVVTGEYFQRWARAVNRIIGLDVRFSGEIPRGAYLVPNHQSYLDVIALASVMPVTFVSKAEVGSWPVIGFLVRTADQILLERLKNRNLVKCLSQVGERLREGHNVCVFLEGTTSGGDRIQRFHSPLLQPAIEQGAPVVPVALRWHSRNPQILISEDVAYWKDHHFAKHVFRLLGLRGICASIRVGKAIGAGGWDRTGLASKLQEGVEALFSSLHATEFVQADFN